MVITSVIYVIVRFLAEIIIALGHYKTNDEVLLLTLALFLHFLLFCCSYSQCVLSFYQSFHLHLASLPVRLLNPLSLLGSFTNGVPIYPQDGPVHESLILLRRFPYDLRLPSQISRTLKHFSTRYHILVHRITATTGLQVRSQPNLPQVPNPSRPCAHG